MSSENGTATEATPAPVTTTAPSKTRKAKPTDPNTDILEHGATYGAKQRFAVVKTIGNIQHTITLTGTPLAATRAELDRLASAGGKWSYTYPVESFDKGSGGAVFDGEGMTGMVDLLASK